jgi:hypothetical protein
MKFSKRTKYMLFGSFIFLVISLRYPTTPHEIGWDSFFIHGLVNNLNHQGNFASWWIHPLSPFGLTPFSYASAVPVLVSAFSQASGLSIEITIWLFGILCGILGIFGSYLVAKELLNNDVYIFLVVFGFSTCENFLAFTTWTLTTRGFFITIMPFFLFLLFRNVNSKKFNTYSILIVLIFILLVAIHHLYTFLIFPIISYFFLKKIYPFKNLKKSKNLRKIIIIISGIFLFIIVLLIFFDILTSAPLTGQEGRIYESKFDWFKEIIKLYARQLGILGLFGIFGFVIILFKKDKSLNEIILIFIVLFLSPFILIATYMISFIAIFIYMLAALALITIYKFFLRKKKKRFAIVMFISILSISFAFSVFYQIWHPGIESETVYNEIYMEEDNYSTGLWLRYSTNDSTIYSNDEISLYRIAGVMNLKQFAGSSIEQLKNGFISTEDYEVKILSPLEPYFWSETFYKTEPDQSALNWKANQLKQEMYLSGNSKDFIQKYDIKYVLEHNQLLIDEEYENKRFFISLNENCYKIYSNPELSVWYIN